MPKFLKLHLMQNVEIGNSLTSDSLQTNDNPFDEGESTSLPSRACETQRDSRLDYSCISELGQGFKGMLEEMSKDPREVERLKNPNKMRKQRSNTSATPRHTLSSLSSNNSISSSTTSSTRRSPTSTIVTTFLKEEQSTQKEEETEVEEGLEILLAPLTAKKTNPPKADLAADEPTTQDKKLPDSNASKGKSDLKQWASRLVTQKRRAKNTANEKLREAVPLANALSDVSEGGTPFRHRMREGKSSQTTSISKSFNPVSKSAPTFHHANSTHMDERRPTYDTEAFPDDEFNELSYNSGKVPHPFNPATITTEIEVNRMRRRSDPAPEDETPIRTNTTSSKPHKINHTSNGMFFLPSADFDMLNNNPDLYDQSDLYPSKAQFMKPQLPPKQTRPIAPIAPPRQTSSHIHAAMPMNNSKILMTPPSIKSRVLPHSLLHVNVVTPAYTAAPREIQKKSSIEPSTLLDVELSRPKDLAKSHHSTSSASIKNSTFDNLIQDETRESAHLPPTSTSQTLSPRATVVATSKEVFVEQWLALKCPYLHPDDLRNYAKKLTDMGFDSKMMLENELRGDDLNFMKVAHKRVILSSLGL